MSRPYRRHQALYVCKECGAESPPGIGYVLRSWEKPERDKPAPGCPNPHLIRRSKRPWKVFVRNIGPTFSFTHEADARARAEALVGPEEIVVNNRLHGSYGEVLVYESNIDIPVADWRRTVYRYNRPPVEEQLLSNGQWKEIRIDATTSPCEGGTL